MRVNGALFYSDYTDMQLTIQRATTDGGDFASQVMNAGESTVQGGELEIIAQITDSLKTNLTIGYIDAEFDQVDYFDPNLQQTIDVSDDWSFANTPEMTISAGFDYGFSTDWGDFVWNGTLAHRDSTQIFEVPSPLDFGAYTLFNMGLTFYSNDGDWWAGLHAKNIFDKEYRIAGYNFAATFDEQGNVVAPGLGGDDNVIGYYGDPATVSLTVGYRF